MEQITGAELFVKALKEEAVDTLFAYPGGGEYTVIGTETVKLHTIS